MAMQWEGWVSIDGNAVPCSAAGLDLNPNPQFGETIHNKGHVINYAQGQSGFTGSIEFPLFRSFMATLWAFAITARDTGKVVIVSPDGDLIYRFPSGGTITTPTETCLVNSLTIRGNMNGVVTGSLELVATSRDTSGAVPTFTATTGVLDHGANTTTLTINQTPIPYWKTSFVNATAPVYGGASDDTQVTAWDITITNNQLVLYTFDATNEPNRIQPGLMDVSGNVSLYNASGAPLPKDGHGVTITIDNDTLTLNYLVYTGFPIPISSPNEKAIRNCAFRVLGDLTNAPIRE